MKVTVTITADEIAALQKYADFTRMGDPCATCGARRDGSCCGCIEATRYTKKANEFKDKYDGYRDVFNSDFGKEYVKVWNDIYKANEEVNMANNRLMHLHKEFDKLMEKVEIEKEESLAENALDMADSVLMGD